MVRHKRASVFALLAVLAGCSSGTLGSRPVVTNLSATSGKNIIPITLTVSDGDKTACNIAVEFQIQGETVWQPATIVGSDAGTPAGNSVVGLWPGPGGMDYILQWDSWVDGVAVGGPDVNVTLRVTPSDVDGTGDSIESSFVTVNNHIAVLEVLVPTGTFAHGWGDAAGPADQTLEVFENTGTTGLDWTLADAYTPDVPAWMTFTASGNTGNGATQSLTLGVDLDADGQALEPGTYVAVLTIDSVDARDVPQDITVTLTIDPPVMNVDQTEIDFEAGFGGAAPANLTFEVQNTATGTGLRWEIDPADTPPSWLDIDVGTPSDPLAGGSADTVTLSVDHASPDILAPGVYSHTITILDKEDPDVATITNDQVVVTLTVNAPDLEATPASLDFVGIISYAAPGDQTFDIQNAVAGTSLDWDIDTAGWPSWLTLSSATSGTVAGGGSDTLTLSVDHVGFATPTVQTFTVTVRDSEDPDVATITNDDVLVTLTVRNPQPDIGLNGGSSIDMTCVQGQPLGVQAFNVTNVGDVGSTLAWNAGTPSAGWLSLSPTTNASGPLAQGASESVAATINTAGLIANPGVPDEYVATVVFTGLGAGGEPTLSGNQTLTVSVDMLVPPQTDIDDVSPSFADGIANVSYPINEEITITLTNSGEFDLDWTATWNAKPAWLEVVSPATLAASGTVLPGGTDSDTFTFKVDSGANGLSAGTYTGSVDITDQFSNTTTVTFTMVIKKQAALATSPASITMNAPEGGENPVATVNIWNSDSDDSPFNWTISTAAKPSELSLSATSGSCSSEIDTVTLTFNSAGLFEGDTYVWTLTVNSSDATGAPDSIVVTMNVVEPYIWVDCINGTAGGPGTEAAPYQTIAQAMGVAVTGNTVMVKPGTYVEEVIMPATPIQLIAQHGAAITTIQAPVINQGEGVTTYSSTGNLSTVEGFTIRNFYYGIYAYRGANVRDCIIEDNYLYGIFIYFAYGSRIERNIIRGTLYTSSSYGALRLAGGYTAYVIDNLIVGNAGNGVYLYSTNGEPNYLINNTVADNNYYGLRIIGNGQDMVTVMNNTCVYNGWYGIYAEMGPTGYPTLGNNNVYGNSSSNYGGGLTADASDISLPPGFVGSGTYPYYLGAGTNCIDSGDNTAPELPAVDILGGNRIYGSFVDIGCYEWSPGALPTVNHFDFGTVSSPKAEDTPFSVTITAKTAADATATDFDGAVLLSATGAPTAGTQTIGTGTSSYIFPMFTGYDDARTQAIYLASEIGSAMQITSLALYVVTPPVQTMNNWTIRMKHTSLAQYPSPAQFEGSGWTTVYQSNVSAPPTGWKTFSFSTPFYYNGTSNLMVDFSFNNTYYTTPSGTSRYTYSSPSYRMAYGYRDSDYGDPLTWVGSSSPGCYRSYYLPNIRLGGLMAQIIAVNPPGVGPFINGVWTGGISVMDNSTGVVVDADDGNGHTGQTNSFNVNP